MGLHGVNDILQVEYAILKVDRDKKMVRISTRAIEVLNDLQSRFVLSPHARDDELMETPHVLDRSINQKPQLQTLRSEILPYPRRLLDLNSL